MDAEPRRSTKPGGSEMTDARNDPEHNGHSRKPKRNHLISRKKFRTYIAAHPESAKDKPAFDRWCKAVEQAIWTKFADVKATIGSADQVGDLVVFNIGGHKYRVIARIDYRKAKFYLKHILTHEDYDKE
jgi:mRNA interferase HigB